MTEPVQTPTGAVQLVPIDRLQPDPRNPRTHPPDQVRRLALAIERFGFLPPILTDAEFRILAGHGRLQAARLLGLTEVPVLVRDHLDDQRFREARLADNRLGELSAWDGELLLEELRALDALDARFDAVGWSEREIDRLIRADVDDEETEAPEEPEAVPRPVTELDDLWILGGHRIVCADSLDGDAAERALGGEKAAAVVTDPPYAIYGSASGVSSSVTDDKIVRPFFRALCELAQRVTPTFAHVYIFCDWRSWPSIWESAKATRLEPKNLLVWTKNGSGLGSFYANTHELVGFFVNCPVQRTMRSGAESGHRSVFAPNVIEADRPRGEDRLHNAAKPLALLERFVRNSTDDGALVLDPFGGSGSTLIACELTRRRCAMVDVDPRMVDVTVRRWQRRTGLAARHAKTGRDFGS